ncbi:type II toxin-antitoxin system Phd/YefM family antitoxin [Evtepia sp.]|jgi:antitoxin YefM|uniref:type II toxin-antitoxin system Phd/YefM family antitoxin n=1 Tax=Evtepia sp. TaxID=2773933 RepID=UPI002E7A1A77|nr:type II toxin-antitoxin system Phd/YefM family antitoxin [Evtepia sp.]MEE0257829.1 type II toxin-antitoxin system Phd/YefM family antitoxin [Evtepia sp.]
MINTNVTHFRKNVSTLLEQTLKFNEPIHVSTRNGNVVVLSEDDYRGILETLEMNANPVMKQKLLEGKDTPLSECIPESEVEW